MRTFNFRNPRRTVGAGRNRREASALIFTLIALSITLGAIGSMVRFGTYQTRDTARYEVYKDEFAAAEAGLNKAVAHVKFMVQHRTPLFNAELALIQPPAVKGVEFDPAKFNVQLISDQMEPVTEGQWTGLDLQRQRLSITVNAKRTEGIAEGMDHPGVTLSQQLMMTNIPLFMFAIFYNPEMEIAPGPYMQVTGRVHCNTTSYFQSNSGLDFRDYVTVAGDVNHGRHPASGQSGSNGYVRITDGSSQINMGGGNEANGDGWLTSLDSNWTSEAITRWSGRMKSAAHGVEELNLPLPVTADPHTIIERANPGGGDTEVEKFEVKSDLIISMNSSGVVTAKTKAGVNVPLYNVYVPGSGNPGTRVNLVSVNEFYDAREKQTVRSLNVDLRNMQRTNTYPANGIMYVSAEDKNSNVPGVVRLQNGSNLPRSPLVEGLTIASDDPVYVQGNYNTTNKTKALVAGDAVMILSNAWNDSNSTNYGNRNATETTTNVVMINGIVPSQNGKYSGGVENYFRYLENWSGVRHNFSGSIVQLWESQKHTAPWGSGSVYSPPQRYWSWDSSLANGGPPGTPVVIEYEISGWKVG